MSPTLQQALCLYASLPRAERFHLRARAFSAPLEAVAARVPPGPLHVADIGCGHGLLSALLALGDSARHVHGVDPDPRKVAWARQGLGALPNVRLEVGTVETLAAARPGGFDVAIVCDVLYLFPETEWPGFLRAVRSLLRPGGRLLLKEAEGNRSWKHYKGVVQELVMVRLLGRTKTSGGLVLKPRAEVEALLHEAGYTVHDAVALDRGYTTPHILYEARVV